MSRAIVAREYRICLVAGNLARGLLRDAAADPAPRSEASKIMEQQAGKFRCVTRLIPIWGGSLTALERLTYKRL